MSANKEVELAVALDKGTYAGDRELLSRVWANLLHNGITFTSSYNYSCYSDENRVILK